jgi:quercetin 2,3-dioxygenase
VSNLETRPVETECGGRDEVARTSVPETLEGHPVALGGPRGMTVTRTLPNRTRRMVGAWCFLDAYGPQDLSASPGMRVGPHPHTGLQTVSWLAAGEILHRDSLDNVQLAGPGQLNLMTAGRGIAHSEQTPPKDHSKILHGVQMWVALPDAHRNAAPRFEHHPELPAIGGPGWHATVIMGELDGTRSPATCYSPLLAAQIRIDAGSSCRLPLSAGFEYAALTVAGAVLVNGQPLRPGPLRYLGSGNGNLRLAAADGTEPALAMIIGGEPFTEQLVMWWNFVARDHNEIVQARQDWIDGRRFGPVSGYDGDPIPAPAMPTTPLKSRGRIR